MTTVAELNTRLNLDAAQFIETAKESEGALKRLSESAEFAKRAFEFFAIAEATESLIEFVRAGSEAAEKISVMAEQFGASAQQIQDWTYAARLSGVAQDALATGADHLAKNMELAQRGSTQQVDAFRAIGVSVTDATGRLRPMEAVLGDIADRFKSYADGPNKAALAQALFGRSGTELIGVLNQGSDGLADLANEARKLGVVLDGETIAKAKEAGDEFKRMEAVTQAIKIRLAADLQPTLHTLTGTFAEVGQQGSLTEHVMTAIEAVFKGGASAAIFLAETVTEAGEDLGALAAAANLAAHGDFSGAARVWAEQLDSDAKMQDEAAAKIGEIWSSTNETIKKSSEEAAKPQAPAFTRSPAESAKAQFAILNAQTQAALNLLKESDRETQAVYDAMYKRGDLDLRSYFEDRLGITRSGIDAEIGLIQQQIAQTEKLMKSGTAEEQVGLKAKLIELTGRLELAEAKRDNAALDSTRELIDQLNREQAAIQAIAIEHEAQLQKITDAARLADVQYLYAQLGITDRDYFAKLKQIEQDSYAAEVETERERLANFVGTQEEKERAAAESAAKMEELELQHQQKLVDIDRQAELKRTEFARQASDSIKTSITDDFAAILSGQESFSKAFHNLVLDIQKDLDQLVAKTLVEQSFGSGTSGGGALSGLTGLFSGGAGAAGGSAPLSGLYDSFGGFFSGLGFADGGSPPVGMASLVGEHGPELFVPASPGTILSHDEMKGLMGGGGTTVVQHFQISAPQGQISKQTQNQLLTAGYVGARRVAARNG